ncbi:hypothetical protein [Virgibacillus halodenitrificans]|uniref:hypothetical protein n=1 Tax=Virgibacillus halodenitrificans TaxID=1482 RepID=UPI000EF4837E|nr:hypothetical protein [Virgibacillus halodenitrificans]
MSRQLKRRYKKDRVAFKLDLYQRFRENPALAMLAIETYVAWHHRRHITMIWAMFRNPEYKNFHRAYSKELFGKHLTGSSDIWKSLYFTDKELHDKYNGKIPVKYAMGDALSVAYNVLKEKQPNNDF